MDVRCNRCATEYDFDDALISERGTTVRCTHCGFQFKVFPPRAEAGAPERWVVRSAAGRELVFTSLRELQRAIADHQVQPEDLLSRGREPGRPLSSIAELEQFFKGPQSAARVQRLPEDVRPSWERTPPPEGPLLEAKTVRYDFDDLASTVRRAPAPEATQAHGPGPTLIGGADAWLEPPAPPARRVATRAGPEPVLQSPALPAAAAVLPPVQPALERTPASNRGVALPNSLPNALESGGTGPANRRSQPEISRDLVMTPAPRSSPRASNPFLNAPISSGRPETRSYDEIPMLGQGEAPRRARSRWIAAVVLGGVLALFAATLGRRYLLEASAPVAETNASSNARVAELLRDGNRLADEGDFEGAHEQLLKASGLVEKDPAVLAALAHLETLRADVSWLKLRLLDPTVSELVRATRRELGVRVGKARSASDAAFAVAPEDSVVLRARVDALRLSGEAVRAREWIKPIALQASDPNNAYVLSALDMAEANPSWPSIVERLQNASAAETTPGRAHAALIYALANAGRLTEAEAELAKLDSRPKGALLIDELKSFVRRQRAPGDAGVQAAPSTSVVSAPGTLGPEPRRAGDFRSWLADAARAFGRGDLERAQRLYQQVLTDQPNNTEALAGLGDVARRRNDPATANQMYERVIAQNPQYLPALIASADYKWNSGDQQGALILYRRVLDQAGSGTEYGQRAAARITEANAAATRGAEPSAPQVSSTAPAEPSVPSSPQIDTTDLPEFR